MDTFLPFLLIVFAVIGIAMGIRYFWIMWVRRDLRHLRVQVKALEESDMLFTSISTLLTEVRELSPSDTEQLVSVINEKQQPLTHRIERVEGIRRRLLQSQDKMP
jgi:hypothetical protein